MRSGLPLTGAAAAYEYESPSPTNNYPQIGTTGGQGTTGGTGYSYAVPTNVPSLNQFLATAADPVSSPGSGSQTGTIPLYPGVLNGVYVPGTQTNTMTGPSNYLTKIPAPTISGSGKPANYFWVCLRRPANPFAPVSLANPMLVVDSMRVPYIDGTGATVGSDGMTPANPLVTGAFNTIYSAQRFQPYRGGHAVAIPGATGTPTPIDTRYGFSEQIVAPTTNSLNLQTQGIYFQNATGSIKYPATYPIYHTLGWANEYEQGSEQGPTPSAVRDVGLPAVPRPRFHERGGADAGAGGAAGALDEAIRRVCAVVQQHHEHLCDRDAAFKPDLFEQPERCRCEPVAESANGAHIDDGGVVVDRAGADFVHDGIVGVSGLHELHGGLFEFQHRRGSAPYVPVPARQFLLYGLWANEHAGPGRAGGGLWV